MTGIERLKAVFGAKPKRQLSKTDRTLYEADQRDRYLLAAGQKYSPQNLLTYITRADTGDTRWLYAFYDEMISRDAHLATELGKAAGAIAGARLQVLAYPSKYRTLSKKKSASADDKLPADIAGFVEEQLKRPDLNLHDGIESWCNGKWKGLGACEVHYAPMSAELPNGKTGTGLDRFVPIPSQRFRFDPSGVELWLQPTGDPSITIPASKFPPGQIAYYIANADRPNPSRRGVLRLVMPNWISRSYGPGWWSRFLELYGSPLRVGKANSNDPDTMNQLSTSLAQMANTGYVVLPAGATIEFIEGAARSLSMPPHQTFMDWNADEITKVFRGATQTTKIAPSAGSQASATVHKDVSEEIDQERAKNVAAVLRNQVAYWLVAKNWGEDIAKKFTPEIILDVHGQPDFTIFSQGLGFWKTAGMGPSTPLQWAHDTAGVPMADEDDETMGGPVDPAVPAVGPDGKPVENDPVKIAKATKPPQLGPQAKPLSKSGPGQTPKKSAKLSDNPYDIFADALTGQDVIRSAVPAFDVPAHEPAGMDIVNPIKSVLDKAIAENQPLPVILARVKHRLGATHKAQTAAILSRVIAEATFRGMESAKREAATSEDEAENLFDNDEARDDHGRWTAEGISATVAKAHAELQGGGFSRSINSGGKPSGGFMVSVAGHEQQHPQGTVTPEHIAAYVVANRDLLQQNANYVGGWNSNGKTYLDVSHRHDNEEDAYVAAVKNKQHAYYDVSKEKDVPTMKDGKVLPYRNSAEHKLAKGLIRAIGNRAKPFGIAPYRDIP